MSRGDHNWDTQHELLDQLVVGEERPISIAALREYFRSFSGRWFDRFEGGSHSAATVNVITTGDVLSLTHLGISDGLSELAVAVVDHADRITELLAGIPLDRIYEVSHGRYDTVLGKKSPAWELWDLLRTSAGGSNKWVTASKLLARKRPDLIPVYDTVVQKQLNGTNNAWMCLWSWFHDDPTRIGAVLDLRDVVGGIDDISLLRCLDVALWMRGRHQD